MQAGMCRFTWFNRRKTHMPTNTLVTGNYMLILFVINLALLLGAVHFVAVSTFHGRRVGRFGPRSKRRCCVSD